MVVVWAKNPAQLQALEKRAEAGISLMIVQEAVAAVGISVGVKVAAGPALARETVVRRNDLQASVLEATDATGTRVPKRPREQRSALQPSTIVVVEGRTPTQLTQADE